MRKSGNSSSRYSLFPYWSVVGKCYRLTWGADHWSQPTHTINVFTILNWQSHIYTHTSYLVSAKYRNPTTWILLRAFNTLVQVHLLSFALKKQIDGLFFSNFGETRDQKMLENALIVCSAITVREGQHTHRSPACETCNTLHGMSSKCTSFPFLYWLQTANRTIAFHYLLLPVALRSIIAAAC